MTTFSFGEPETAGICR